jgi:hypothetical protein
MSAPDRGQSAGYARSPAVPKSVTSGTVQTICVVFYSPLSSALSNPYAQTNHYVIQHFRAAVAQSVLNPRLHDKR